MFGGKKDPLSKAQAAAKDFTAKIDELEKKLAKIEQATRHPDDSVIENQKHFQAMEKIIKDLKDVADTITRDATFAKLNQAFIQTYTPLDEKQRTEVLAKSQLNKKMQTLIDEAKKLEDIYGYTTDNIYKLFIFPFDKKATEHAASIASTISIYAEAIKSLKRPDPDQVGDYKPPKDKATIDNETFGLLLAELTGDKNRTTTTQDAGKTEADAKQLPRQTKTGR